MKNTLGDLNNILFEQLERINDDSLSKEQLEAELKKADAVCKISDKIIQTGEIAFKTMKHMDEYGYNTRAERRVPVMLSAGGDFKDGKT